MGNLLLVTIQVDMHDRLAMTLQDDLTERIVRDGAKGVLIDISALDLVDSFIGRMISNTAAMARVLDARPWWSACSRRSRSRWSSWA
jgi:rsbT antagonist protein RsbS